MEAILFRLISILFFLIIFLESCSQGISVHYQLIKLWIYVIHFDPVLCSDLPVKCAARFRESIHWLNLLIPTTYVILGLPKSICLIEENAVQHHLKKLVIINGNSFRVTFDPFHLITFRLMYTDRRIKELQLSLSESVSKASRKRTQDSEVRRKTKKL